MVTVLDSHYIKEDPKRAAEVMGVLAKTNRFSLNLMFLPDSTQKSVASIFAQLEKKGTVHGLNKKTLAALKQSWS